MHVRLLAQNGSYYEYAQYCFPKSYHVLSLWQTSGEVAESRAALSGQPYIDASLYGSLPTSGTCTCKPRAGLWVAAG